MASVTAEAMIKAAGLDWKVEKQPAPGARQRPGSDAFDRYQIVREPVDEEKQGAVLAVVGHSYEILQNIEAFTFFQPFIDDGWATFHTAGALGNGERVWVLIKLNEDIIVGGNDPVQRFLLLSNSHDGSAAVSIRFTPIRVVCQNTLNLAKVTKAGGESVISVRHSRNVARNLADAQTNQLKRLIDKTFADAGTLFGQMALKAITIGQRERYLQALFPKTEEQKKKGRVPERWWRVDAILDDSNVTPDSTRDTLWALYNAVVRDEDYRDGARMTEQSRLNRVWFGDGHDLKVKALRAARQFLKAAA